MTAEDQIKQLISVTSRLSSLVKQENEILSADGRPNGMKDIVAEKQALSGAYEAHVKILQDEDALRTVDASVRRRLHEVLEIFTTLMAENRTRLNAKMEATKRVFSVIADAAREQQPKVGAYGRSGARQARNRQAYAPVVSVGMNQEL